MEEKKKGISKGDIITAIVTLLAVAIASGLGFDGFIEVIVIAVVVASLTSLMLKKVFNVE